MGSFSILNNIAGLNSQNQLNLNNVNLQNTLMRLSTGQRINSGADDAAGLRIADSLRANTFALNQAVRNANDGISVAQIADGALQQVTNLLTRSVTLAEQAATDTVDDAGRASLANEFSQIQAEIARIAETINFNGTFIFRASAPANPGSDLIPGDPLADPPIPDTPAVPATPAVTGLGGSLNVFVGDMYSASSISVEIGMIATGTGANAGTVTGFGGAGNISTVDLTDAAGAATALGTINTALGAVADMRAAIGAGINRLQSAISVLQTQAQNTQAAESAIRDANMAEEISNLTRYQILSQTGIAALSQANAQSQSVLALLR
ncbi:MAG TPA: flagellin [Acidobacteriota bacterium]|nr:flagellin [Acidobacteriota bacterium]